MTCRFLGSSSSNMNRNRLMQVVTQSCHPHRLHTLRRLKGTEGACKTACSVDRGSILRKTSQTNPSPATLTVTPRDLGGDLRGQRVGEEGIGVFTVRSLWIHSCL